LDDAAFARWAVAGKSSPGATWMAVGAHRYADLDEQHLPIGSGVVESAV